MVPQDVEVETRVNPLPSYPTKYEMMYSKRELEQIQADIEDYEREAIEAVISVPMAEDPIVGSPRSPIVEEADSS